MNYYLNFDLESIHYVDEFREKRIEEWKDVIGYEGIYLISNFGRLKSIKFNKERILKPSFDGRGYLNTILWKKGINKSFKIAHLVAYNFIGKRPKNLVINHINGIKADNNVDNLEYVTYGENSKHAYKIGLKISKKCKKYSRPKLVPYPLHRILKECF